MQGHSRILVQLLGKTRGVIKDANPIWGSALYEIWTVFFPWDLPSTAIEALEGPSMRGPIDMSPGHQMHEDPGPCGGFLGRDHGWAYSPQDGAREDATAVKADVEYAGQRARRLVYFFRWHDEDAQARYKREMCWSSRDRTMVASNAMDVFLHDLEELGMLGYETQQGRFVEVTKY